MKSIHLDPEKMSEAMDKFKNIHDALSFLRSEIKTIEEVYFSLIGEEFGDLLVRQRRDIERQESTGIIVIPAWLCDCSCGAEIKVEHEKLINGEIKNCGNESHTNKGEIK